MFSTGLSKYYGLVKPGVEAGAIEQGGAWFTFPNGTKVQGEASIYTDDPESTFDKQFLDKIDEWALANYCYGSDADIPPDDAFESLVEEKPNEDAESKIDNI